MRKYLTYYPPADRFTPEHLQEAMNHLINVLQWEQHDPNRKEAFINPRGVPYLYGGKREGYRPLYPQPVPYVLAELWRYAEETTRCMYDVVFVNWYLNAESHIGWHKDNSPSLNPYRPVSILSLGDVRMTSFRDTKTGEVIGIPGKPGSIMSMEPGCQDHYEHAVLPVPGPRGARMSLVFRSLLRT